MKGYGQFCPVAITAEVLTERWTPLIVRELLGGSSRFNDLRRGLPLISPSLLAKRLRMLERVGVVERVAVPDGHAAAYRLTEAGHELRPLIDAMGVWGQRWGRGDVRPDHLDASLLMWDIHRNIETAALPEQRVVVHFRLDGSSDGKRDFWLVLDRGQADICLTDPGFGVHVEVEAHVATFVRIWLGDLEFAGAIRTGELTLTGPTTLTRAFPTWFSRSVFADVARPAAAR